LGVHLDGYCALVAHTAVVGGEDGSPATPVSDPSHVFHGYLRVHFAMPWPQLTGSQADVVAAAHAAADVVVHMIKPGVKNYEVLLVFTFDGNTSGCALLFAASL
jgi:methionine aminopeptidase